MIIRALKTNQLDFLYCVWAFNKNFYLRPNIDLEDVDIAETESDEEGNPKILQPQIRKDRC